MKKVVYISGKMTGLKDKGRETFNYAEERLRAAGWKVMNPACLPDDLPDHCYMPVCLSMLRESDLVAVLPNWTDSPGAHMETSYATYIGKPVFTMAQVMYEPEIVLGMIDEAGAEG